MSQAKAIDFRPKENESAHSIIDDLYHYLALAARKADELNRKYPNAIWGEGFTAQVGNFKAKVNLEK